MLLITQGHKKVMKEFKKRGTQLKQFSRKLTALNAYVRKEKKSPINSSSHFKNQEKGQNKPKGSIMNEITEINKIQNRKIIKINEIKSHNQMSNRIISA